MGLKYFEEFVKRNFNEEVHQEVNVPYVRTPGRRPPPPSLPPPSFASAPPV